MSVEQIEQRLMSLSSEERRNFANWFHEHEEELLGESYIHAQAEAEILRRRDAAVNHPEKLEPWEEVFPRMKQRFDELRHKDTQPG